MQDASYPDPDQLKTFAREPMPFHGFRVADLELLDTNHLRYGVENVEYRFAPAYINVETSEGEWERASDVEWVDVDHQEAWEKAEAWEEGEDFYIATYIHPDPEQPHQVHAYWILETIEIRNQD
jgi:hypothetical protein